MSTIIMLWLVRETGLARLYCKHNRPGRDEKTDCIWVPKSIVEHTTKRGTEHMVKLPDWFIRKNGL